MSNSPNCGAMAAPGAGAVALQPAPPGDGTQGLAMVPAPFTRGLCQIGSASVLLIQ